MRVLVGCFREYQIEIKTWVVFWFLIKDLLVGGSAGRITSSSLWMLVKLPGSYKRILQRKFAPKKFLWNDAANEASSRIHSGANCINPNSMPLRGIILASPRSSWKIISVIFCFLLILFEQNDEMRLHCKSPSVESSVCWLKWWLCPKRMRTEWGCIVVWTAFATFAFYS